MSAKEITTLVESQRQIISMALPAHVSVDRIIRMARTCVSTNPLIGKCSPRSVLGSVIQCAQLGLEPGISAHLVPYWNNKSRCYEAQMIADYRGLMQLARRSGNITAIYSDIVRDGDQFDFRRGTDPYINHRPSLSPHQGDPIAAYAVASFKSGGHQFEVMSAAEINAVRDASLSKIKKEEARKYSPWSAHYNEMARKTVIRRLCKYLPMSTEDSDLQRAIVLDEAADRGEQRAALTVDLPALEDATAVDPVIMSDEDKAELENEIDGQQNRD